MKRVFESRAPEVVLATYAYYKYIIYPIQND